MRVVGIAAFVVVVLAWSRPAAAQLAAGDVAFTGARGDTPDVVAFVALVDLPSGTTINVTDNGWLASGAFRAGEGNLAWTSTSTVARGTVVVLSAVDSAAAAASTGTLVRTGGFDISISGDSLIAFQGAAATPTLISALQLGLLWNADATSANTSAQPAGLVEGVTALAVGNTFDNVNYDCSIQGGMPPVLRDEIYTASRWTGSDNPITVPGMCTFTPGPIVDDFEDGTIQGWRVGQDPQPVNVSTGGPTGAGDSYLVATSLGGGGPHSKLVVFNDDARWAGNYTVEGRTTIYLHARNSGSTEVVLRLRLTTPLVGASAVTTQGKTLPAGSGWTLLAFDVTAPALTGADPAAVLTDVARVWIYHSSGAFFPGPSSVAELGIDDVSEQPLAPMCGDSVVNGADLCDGSDLGGQSCTDFGYVAPAGLQCNATCDAYVTSGCTASCGNGTAEPGEACDTGGNSPTCDANCTPVSCGDGTCNGAAGETAASCSADCPTVCGDTLITGTEVCDGTNLAGQDCADHGYVAPAGLACAGTCAAFVTTGCTAACGNSTTEPGEACDAGGETAACDGDCTAVSCGDARCNAAAGENAGSCPADCGPVCGDGFVTGAELCDGSNLAGQDCTDHGYVAAAGLACAGTCAAFVTSGCTAACGNSTTEPGEACDGGGVDTLTCDADCTAPVCGDTDCNAIAGENAASCGADCPTTCGDLLVTGAEMCDGTNLDGQDCTDHGYVAAGGLACAGACDAFVTAGCAAACGNGTAEPGEPCDSGGVDAPTCDADCTAVSCGDTTCNAPAGETQQNCPADCGVPPDAGVPDAAVPDDAMPADAVAPDPDAAAGDPPDAGMPPGGGGGGCCGASSEPGGGIVSAALTLLGLLGPRRRRRRPG